MLEDKGQVSGYYELNTLKILFRYSLVCHVHITVICLYISIESCRDIVFSRLGYFERYIFDRWYLFLLLCMHISIHY